MFSQRGEEAKIQCSHSIQGYSVILWYKLNTVQHLDSGLQLLGYMNVNHGYIEPGVKVTIEGSAMEGKMCTLTVRGLDRSSSALYFCAASEHSDVFYCSREQKPPSVSDEASHSCIHHTNCVSLIERWRDFSGRFLLLSGSEPNPPQIITERLLLSLQSSG